MWGNSSGFWVGVVAVGRTTCCAWLVVLPFCEFCSVGFGFLVVRGRFWLTGFPVFRGSSLDLVFYFDRWFCCMCCACVAGFVGLWWGFRFFVLGWRLWVPGVVGLFGYVWLSLVVSWVFLGCVGLV